MSVVAEFRERVGFQPEGRRIVHTIDQIMTFAAPLLERRPAGVLVEAGAYQGVGTARLSHLAAMIDARLVVFDSFRGLPQHREPHRHTITGRSVAGWFRPGALASPLEVAQETVAEHGVPGVVDWVPGWFADTMPDFDLPVAGAYLDVDLAVSTRTCLDYLWPLVVPGGVVVSQDGHLPLVVAEIRAWLSSAVPTPRAVEGLGERQMVRILR